MRLALAFALLCACQADPITPPEGTLIVYAPLEGTVTVRGRAQPIWPPSPARFEGLGRGPYDVTLSLPEARVTLVSVDGEVDFGPLLGVQDPLPGPLVDVEVTAEGAPEIVGIIDAQRSPLRGGRVTATAGRPLILIALWRGAGAPTQLAVRRLEDPRNFEGRAAHMTPAWTLSQGLRVTLDAPAPAWIGAELTFAGIRTGLQISEASAYEGAATLLGLEGGLHEGLGLWIEARWPAWRGGATAGQWISAATRALSLEAPPAAAFAPAPSRARSAPPLSRQERSFSGGAEASLFEITLEGYEACGQGRPWRIFVEGLDQLRLPTPDDQDPLQAPLIYARITRHTWPGQGFEARGRRAPDWSAGYHAQTVEGWYSGGGCEAGDAQPARYALEEPGEACGADGLRPRVIQDRCGRLISLGEACLSGDEGDPEAPARIELGAGRALSRLDASGIPALQSLSGAWGWVEISEQREGAAAPPLTYESPPGEVWLNLSEEGLLQIESPHLQLEGRLISYEGGEGVVEVLGAACGASRSLELIAYPGYLHLSEAFMRDGAVWRRRVSAWRG